MEFRCVLVPLFRHPVRITLVKSCRDSIIALKTSGTIDVINGFGTYSKKNRAMFNTVTISSYQESQCYS